MQSKRFEKLLKNDLNYQELSKLDDDEWVLVNCNLIYYLVSFYQRQNRNELVKESLHLIQQHFDNLEVLNYYGIDERSEKLLYRHMAAKDAKVIFKPWEQDDKICTRKFAVLKDIDYRIPLSPSQMPELRKRYIQYKKKEAEDEKHQKELKYRIKKGYIV